MSSSFWCSSICEASRKETELECSRGERAKKLEARNDAKGKRQDKVELIHTKNCNTNKQDENTQSSGNKTCNTVLTSLKYHPRKLNSFQEKNSSLIIDDLDTCEKIETCSNSNEDHAPSAHQLVMNNTIGNNKNFLIYFQDYSPPVFKPNKNKQLYQDLFICKNVDLTIGKVFPENEEKNNAKLESSQFRSIARSRFGSEFFNDMDSIITEEYSMEVSLHEEPYYILTEASDKGPASKMNNRPRLQKPQILHDQSRKEIKRHIEMKNAKKVITSTKRKIKP